MCPSQFGLRKNLISIFRICSPKALIVQAGMNSAAIDVAQKHSIPIVQLVPGGDGSAGIFSLAASTVCLARDNGFAQKDDAALILYTSGTTARPKRVALTHSKLLASANSIAASLQLTAADRCLNVMPLFHVHGVIGALLSSMIAGSSVVCAEGFVAEKFFGWLEQYRPTWYTAAPPIHRAIAAHPPAPRGPAGRAVALRPVVVGSPARDPSVQARGHPRGARAGGVRHDGGGAPDRQQSPSAGTAQGRICRFTNRNRNHHYEWPGDDFASR